MDIEMYENPFYNPRRRRSSRRRNPVAIPHTAKAWFRGIGLLDVASAGVGLAISTALPSWVRGAGKSAVSTTDKALVMGLSVGGALLAGMLMNTISPTAGKYAVLGGLAGTAVKVVTLVRGLPIEGGVKKLTAGTRINRFPAPAPSSPFTGVRLT